MRDVAAAPSVSMIAIGELRPRGLFASKTEDFLDFSLLPARTEPVLRAARTITLYASVIPAPVTPPRPQTAETYFLERSAPTRRARPTIRINRGKHRFARFHDLSLFVRSLLILDNALKT